MSCGLESRDSSGRVALRGGQSIASATSTCDQSDWAPFSRRCTSSRGGNHWFCTARKELSKNLATPVSPFTTRGWPSLVRADPFSKCRWIQHDAGSTKSVAALHGHWTRHITRINRAPIPYPVVHFPTLSDGESATDSHAYMHTREREREAGKTPTHQRVASVSRFAATGQPFLRPRYMQARSAGSWRGRP